MGLKSLSILNKSGISMYWEHIWDSIKLYKKYNLGFFYINEIVSYFLNENSYYYGIFLIKNNHIDYKGTLGYDNINYICNSSKTLKHFFLGKILILKNQEWVIISVNYYNFKRYKFFPRFDDVTHRHFIFKNFKKNILNFKFKNKKLIKWNYKKKF